MQVRVVMTWDIKPGKDEEYFEFVAREFAIGVQRVGWQPTDAWYTLYGNRPKIMMVAMADDLDKMKACLDSEEWKDLQTKLQQFVTNFQQKIVRVTPFFPIV